jgi:SAM-dependent MidA family methyltransferase
VSLKDRLRAEIAALGPISVADYMTRCLHDPLDGYYATRPALGAEGDFVTAPLVSQMFGELIGLWAAQVWDMMGRPARVRLVEVGPGDGTLTADMLRVARAAPSLRDAVETVLVETSTPLATLQRQRLAEAAPDARWISSLAELDPGAPVILVANELLDCLPARQFVWTPQGWAERCVGLGADGELAFGLRPAAPPASLLPQGEKESYLVFESSPAQAAFAAEVARLIVREGGAALLIDYGRDAPGPGDTLQALRRHTRVDPLDTPGEADLTVWADFPAVAAAARAAGAKVAPLLPQGLFLERLGVRERAAALTAARPDRADVLARQLARLVDADQMGRLFKVCAISATLTPPGFEDPS